MLTQSDIFDPINATAFNPFVTGILALIMRRIRQDPTVINRIFEPDSPIGNAIRRVAFNTKTYKVLWSLCGVAFFSKYVNRYLNQRALNFGYYGPSTKFVWDQEIAVVTGGSGGLGKLTVKGLSAAKLKKVVILDIVSPTFDLPDNVVFYKTDITSGEEITRIGDLIRKEVGHPTIIINNAGTGIGKTILESTERSLKLTFNVNAVALFLVTKEFLPKMIENNHGHVLTVASLASFFTPAQMVDYSASKAAALSFSEGLSQELKHRYNARGIRNSVVHPNWIKTPLTTVFNNMDHFFGRQLYPEQVANKVVAQILSQNSGQVLIPSSLSSAASIRAIPNWLQEAVRDGSQDMVVVNKDF